MSRAYTADPGHPAPSLEPPPRIRPNYFPATAAFNDNSRARNKSPTTTTTKKKTRRKKSAERRPLRIPHSAFRNGFLSHRLVSYFDYVLVPLLKLTNYHTRQFLSPPLPFPPPPACHAPDTLNIIEIHLYLIRVSSSRNDRDRRLI